MSHMDPFANIIAPLPFSEGILKALGVALRLAPHVSSGIWTWVLIWEMDRRKLVERFLATRPCQWIAVRIYFPYVIGWCVTALIGLLGYIVWFWMILLAKHAQLCFWGALPCGPCPITIQQLFLPIEVGVCVCLRACVSVSVSVCECMVRVSVCMVRVSVSQSVCVIMFQTESTSLFLLRFTLIDSCCCAY